MISEMQIHTIARQMFERHGATAIAQAARMRLPASKGARPRKPGNGVISKTP